MSSSLLAGLVRLVPRIDPPRLKCGATSGTVSGRVWVVSPATRYLNPSRTPITSSPRLIASMVTDEITPLIPGAGPPPTTIASRPRGAGVSMGQTPRAYRRCARGRGAGVRRKDSESGGEFQGGPAAASRLRGGSPVKTPGNASNDVKWAAGNFAF